jgi:hypothetical protein
MDDRTTVAHTVALIADDLDAKGYAWTGALRQAVRLLHTDDGRPRCERCGQPLDVADTGRPRRFCTDRCRKAAARVRKP